MTQLTGDAGKVFPPDFASLVPKDVVRKVRLLYHCDGLMVLRHY